MPLNVSDTCIMVQMNQALMYSVSGIDNINPKLQNPEKVVRYLLSHGANPNYSDPLQVRATY
jgi:hypothetical protein